MAQPKSTTDLGTKVRALVRTKPSAVLSSLLAGDDARPYGSFVLAASTQEGMPLLLMSDLAEHVRNIQKDPRVSLLFDETSGLEDPLEGARASVLGHAVEDSCPLHRERFLRRHPKARVYANFQDFRIYRVEVERAHLVAGFGKIHWLESADVLASPLLDLAKVEGKIIDEENKTRPGHLGTLLNKPNPKSWQLTGIDCEGVDLRANAKTARLEFAEQAKVVTDVFRFFKEN